MRVRLPTRSVCFRPLVPARLCSLLCASLRPGSPENFPSWTATRKDIEALQLEDVTVSFLGEFIKSCLHCSCFQLRALEHCTHACGHVRVLTSSSP